MGVAKASVSAVLAAALCLVTTWARADVLSDLADQCQSALAAGDQAGFEAAAAAIQARDDIFNAEARKRAEACLSQGYGEPWEYWFPSDSFEPSARIEARIKATSDAKLAKERAATKAAADAADAEAARAANAERVAAMVYLSCSALLARDQEVAMTNSVCVESFLANGLPADLGP
jgi:hypothetical protein